MRCIPLIGLYNTPYHDVKSVGGVFYFQFLGFFPLFLGIPFWPPSCALTPYGFRGTKMTHTLLLVPPFIHEWIVVILFTLLTTSAKLHTINTVTFFCVFFLSYVVLVIKHTIMGEKNILSKHSLILSCFKL